MDWDTTWNCAAGKAADLDADVAYDPWDDDDVLDGDYTILDPADDDRLLMPEPEFDPEFVLPDPVSTKTVHVSFVGHRGPKWLDWILTPLCKTKLGFWLCYKLGLAHEDIDFTVSGYKDDCLFCNSNCPEFDSCYWNPGENRYEDP